MLYTGICEKKDFIAKFVEVLTDNGYFTMVSSNTTTDNDIKAGNSDGFVFKSKTLSNGLCVCFSIKDFHCGLYNGETEVKVRMCEDYKPAEDMGVNGEFIKPDSWRAWFVSKEGNITHETKMKYWIDVLPHRVFIVIQKEHFGYESPSMLYIGFPEMHTQTQVFLMNNGLLLGSNLEIPNEDNIISLRDVVGNYYVSDTLYSLITPKNPNIAGEYQLSPIYTGNTDKGFTGKLDGIWALPAININSGDEVEIDGSRYKVFKLDKSHLRSSFNKLGNTIAIKVV